MISGVRLTDHGRPRIYSTSTGFPVMNITMGQAAQYCAGREMTNSVTTPAAKTELKSATTDGRVHTVIKVRNYWQARAASNSQLITRTKSYELSVH